MDHDVTNSTIHSFPHAFLSKRGEALLIKTLDEMRHQQLLDMYLAYRPRNSFSGLPPESDAACIAWVRGIVATGVSLVALSFEHGLVGHIALFPIDEESCEMLVVVSPEHQRVGIGTELTRCCIQLARELEFERILLNVEARNRIAQHVYEKCGFEYLFRGGTEELDMGLDLRTYCPTTVATVGEVMNRQVATIDDDMSCKVALIRFLEDGMPSMPVVNERGHVIGMISETDLLAEPNIHKRVHDVKTSEVVTVPEGCPLGKVISLFRSRTLRSIPVVSRDSRLVGVVGRKDILRFYLKCYASTPAKAPASHQTV